MSGITGAINTALSGLQFFEAGINAVSNNLANETTPGYAVETVSANAIAGPPGQPGTGVQAAQITRAANGFAAAQLRAANAASQAATTQSTQLTTISGALTNNGDVQAAIDQFFQDFSTLAASPTSDAQRQTVLADARNVTSAVQTAAGVINGVVSGASLIVTQSVASANNLLGQLANINNSLLLAPNDPGLLDQQQQALNSLSSLISINALPQSNGTVILASGGTILLDQSGAQTLGITTASDGTPSITAGNDATPVTTSEADGAIGGAIASVAAGYSALQGLNTLAAVFTSAVNTAQAQGLTPSGAPGGAVFSVPAPSVTALAGNTGAAAISAQITQASAVPVDGGPLLLSYSTSTGWTATDQATGTSFSASGTPPVIAGFTLSITGTPANGDSFTLNPAPDAATGIAVSAASGSDLAAADPYVATPGVLQADGSILNTNAGTVIAGNDTVTSTPSSSAAVVPASAYGQNLQVNFTSSTAYTVTTAGDPTAVLASGTFGGNGGSIAIAYPAGAASGQYWQLPITGAPLGGDELTLTPGGPASGSNAARIAALFTAAGTTSAGTLQQAIIGFGTGLGANAQQAQNLATATSAQVTTATSNLQTVSGVNSDSQAVTLTTYQQAYQAAAQAISAAHTMFESLLQSV